MISALAGLLLQAAAPMPAPPAPPPPESRKGITPARPKAELASLFRDEDYPVEAQRRHENGRTAFRLEVGTDGLVRSCIVTSSSGFESLDSATCRLLTERARYTPAHDRRGRLVTDTVDGSVTWRFDPARLPVLQSTLLVFSLRSTPDGDVTCSIFLNGKPPNEGDCPADLRSEVADVARARGRTQTLSEVNIVAPEGEAEPVDSGNHGTEVFALDVALKIAADGSVLECRVLKDRGRTAADGAILPDGCDQYRRGGSLYRPLSGALAGGPRSVTIRNRAYADPAPVPAATAPPPGPGEPARARANLASLFSDDDYPLEASRKHEQGIVSFRLHVGADGLVDGCAITSSSGYLSLDDTTCRLLTERARFSPARDGQGRATTDSVVGRVTWRLPEEDLTPFKPALYVMTMNATPAGETSCSVTLNGTPQEGEECPAEALAGLIEGARNSDKILEETLVTILTPEGEAERVDGAAHGARVAASESVLRVAPDGALLDCRVVSNERDPKFDFGDTDLDPCKLFETGSRMFEPASGAQAAAPRTVRLKIRGYYRILSSTALPST